MAHTALAGVRLVTVTSAQYPAPQSLVIRTCPGSTLSEEAGLIVRVAARVVVPPLPVQARPKVNVPGGVGVKLWEPAVGRAPLQAPLAVQPVAFVDDQLTVAVCPITMLAGSTVMVTAGGWSPPPADRSAQKPNCVEPPGNSSRFQAGPARRRCGHRSPSTRKLNAVRRATRARE